MKKLLLVLILLLICGNVYAKGFKFRGFGKSISRTYAKAKSYNGVNILTYDELKICLLKQSKIKILENKLNSKQKSIDTLKQQLDSDNYTLNKYNKKDIDKYNKNVKLYNKELNDIKPKIDNFNKEIEFYNKNCNNKQYYQDDYEKAIKSIGQ